MSVYISIPRPVRSGRAPGLVAIVAIVAVVSALAAWAVASFVAGSASKPQPGAVSGASVLRSLTPPQRQYVTAMASLSPVTLAAAFGTHRVTSVDAVLPG